MSVTASPFAGLSQTPHGLQAKAVTQSKPKLAYFLAQSSQAAPSAGFLPSIPSPQQ